MNHDCAKTEATYLALKDLLDVKTRELEKVTAERDAFRKAFCEQEVSLAKDKEELIRQRDLAYKTVDEANEQVRQLWANLHARTGELDDTKLQVGVLRTSIDDALNKLAKLTSARPEGKIVNDAAGVLLYALDQTKPVTENRVESCESPECGNCGGDLVQKTEPAWICPKCEL